MATYQFNNVQILNDSRIILGPNSNSPSLVSGGDDVVIENGGLRFEDGTGGPVISQTGEGATSALEIGFTGNSISITNDDTTINNLVTNNINGVPIEDIVGDGSKLPDNVDVANVNNVISSKTGALLVQNSSTSAELNGLDTAFTGNTIVYSKQAAASSGGKVYLNDSGYNPGDIKPGYRLTVTGFTDTAYVVAQVNEEGPSSSIELTLQSNLVPTKFSGSIEGIEITSAVSGTSVMTVTGTGFEGGEYSQSMVLRVDNSSSSKYYTIGTITDNSENNLEFELDQELDEHVSLSGSITMYAIAPGVTGTNIYEGSLTGFASNGNNVTFANFHSVNDGMNDYTDLVGITAGAISGTSISSSSTASFGSATDSEKQSLLEFISGGDSTEIDSSIVDLDAIGATVKPGKFAIKVRIGNNDYYIGVSELETPSG